MHAVLSNHLSCIGCQMQKVQKFYIQIINYFCPSHGAVLSGAVNEATIEAKDQTN